MLLSFFNGKKGQALSNHSNFLYFFFFPISGAFIDTSFGTEISFFFLLLFLHVCVLSFASDLKGSFRKWVRRGKQPETRVVSGIYPRTLALQKHEHFVSSVRKNLNIVPFTYLLKI